MRSIDGVSHVIIKLYMETEGVREDVDMKCLLYANTNTRDQAGWFINQVAPREVVEDAPPDVAE